MMNASYIEPANLSKIDIGDGKNTLNLTFTPRNPLISPIRRSNNIELPRIPTAKKYKKHRDPGPIPLSTDNRTIDFYSLPRPVTDELTHNVASYHFRFNDPTSFENKHKEVFTRQPTAFRKTRGDALNYMLNSSMQERAFNWKLSDERGSLSPPPTRYLIESLSMDPIDVDIFSVSRTDDFSSSASLRSRHRTARNNRERVHMTSASSLVSVVSTSDMDNLMASSVSSSMSSKLLTRNDKRMRRMKEEDVESRSQITQFELRHSNKDVLATLDKADLINLTDAVMTVGNLCKNSDDTTVLYTPVTVADNDEDCHVSVGNRSMQYGNSLDDYSFIDNGNRGSSVISVDDPLAWTCTTQLSTVSRDISTAAASRLRKHNSVGSDTGAAAPIDKNVKYISKKAVLSQLNHELQKLKANPVIVFTNIIIGDMAALMTCKIFKLRSGTVEIKIYHATASSSNDIDSSIEVGRLLLTSDKLKANTIADPPKVNGSNSEDEYSHNSNGKKNRNKNVSDERWRHWFYNNLLPRISLSPWPGDASKYVININPVKIPVGVGLKWQLTNDSSIADQVESKALYPQPAARLVTLYFRDTAQPE